MMWELMHTRVRQQQCDRAHTAYSRFDLPVLCVGPLWFQSRAPRRQGSWRPTRLLLRVTKNYPSPLSVAASFRADENEINNASITLSGRERDGLFHSSTYSSMRVGSFGPYRLSIFATNTSYMLRTRLLTLKGRTGLFWMENLGMVSKINQCV